MHTLAMAPPVCSDLEEALLDREITEVDLVARLQSIKDQLEEIQGPGMPNVLRDAMQVILDAYAAEVSGLGLPPLM